MTSLWLTLLILASPSPAMHQGAPKPVTDAIKALQAHQDTRADRLAHAYLQHPGALPKDDDTITAKLVIAFARLHGGSPSDALTGLDVLQADHIDLGPHGLALRVEALAAQDDCGKALRVAQALAQESLWALGAWRDVAACMLHHNPTLPVHHPMPEGVQLVHDALVRGGNTSQSPQDAAHALLLAGRLSSAWGDAAGADDLFATTVARFGSLTDGHRAHSERLLLRRTGRLTGPLTQAHQALDVEALRRILQSRTERCALRKDVIRQRARAAAQKSIAPQATLNLARLEHIDQHDAAASAMLSALMHKAARLTAEERATAELMLGDLAFVQGHTDAAAKHWNNAAQAAPMSPYGTIALLHGAAAHVGQGDRTQAAAWLEQAKVRLPLPYAALVVRDDGAATVQDVAQAQAEFARLAQLLGAAPAPPPAAAAAAAKPPSTALPAGRPHLDAPDLMAIELLIEHHMPLVARAYMRRLPAQDLSPTERLVAAHLYDRLGDAFRATLLMGQCDALCRALDPTAQALAYPVPFEAEVLAASHKAHVPAALIYAVMREESGFNPGAKSPRGASGLMQLMPSTADALARQAHVPAPSRAALLQPKVSIVLGAQLLSQLYRHFHGNIAAVAAAYQAGQPKAQNWLKLATKAGKADHLAQVIPLTSSRIYVEHIELAYAHYRALGGALGAAR